MVEYLVCLDRSGGNRLRYFEERSESKPERLRIEVDGKYGVRLVDVDAKVRIDKGSDESAIQRLDQLFAPGATTTCAQVAGVQTTKGRRGRGGQGSKRTNRPVSGPTIINQGQQGGQVAQTINNFGSDTTPWKAEFETFLNGRRLVKGRGEDMEGITDVAVPVEDGLAVLRFTLHNRGTGPAGDYSACITYPAQFTNVKPAAEWTRQPPPDGFEGDQMVSGAPFAHYRVEAKSIVAKGDGVALPPIQIAAPQPMVLSLIASSSTSEKLVTRVRLSFVDPMRSDAGVAQARGGSAPTDAAP